MPSEMKSLAKRIFRCLIRATKATTQSETERVSNMPRKDQ